MKIIKFLWVSSGCVLIQNGSFKMFALNFEWQTIFVRKSEAAKHLVCACQRISSEAVKNVSCAFNYIDIDIRNKPLSTSGVPIYALCIQWQTITAPETEAVKRLFCELNGKLYINLYMKLYLNASLRLSPRSTVVQIHEFQLALSWDSLNSLTTKTANTDRAKL